MPHVVLLGDSICDNAAYVAGGPDVATHLERGLPDGWQATLLAIDGATTQDLPIQYGRIPADVRHLQAPAAVAGDALELAKDPPPRRADAPRGRRRVAERVPRTEIIAA